MTTGFPFVKMNGLGNSFVLMDNRDGEVTSTVDAAALARAICDVHFGIGADGLVLVENSASADVRMVIYNMDGSEAEMCGNGVRCLARFVRDEFGLEVKTVMVETLAGPIRTELVGQDRVRVDMGAPVFVNDDVRIDKTDDQLGQVTILGRPYYYVSMGNPHAISFVEHFDFDWAAQGARVEKDQAHFPNGVNVEYVRVDGAGELTMKVWERGCGPTMACGTGACALTVAAVASGRMPGGQVLVHLPGGDLDVIYHNGGNVTMEGPVRRVCEGVYEYEPI